MDSNSTGSTVVVLTTYCGGSPAAMGDPPRSRSLIIACRMQQQLMGQAVALAVILLPEQFCLFQTALLGLHPFSRTLCVVLVRNHC
jgi:hypothetical protein